MQKEIEGVLPVIIMPYTQDGDINEEDFHLQVDHLINEGADGFVIGQVSELLRLTTAERFRLSELCCEAAKGRCITIMSTGGESIRSAIEYSQQAEAAGIDGLLVMHPSIMALDDKQMFDYFAAVVESVKIPVMVHHAKSLAKKALSLEVQVKLLQTYGPDRVMFKPEAAPTPPRVSLLRDMTNNQAKIFEGDGGMMLLDCYKRGLTGTIPATEIVEISVAIWRSLASGREDLVRELCYGTSYLMCHMMNSIDCYTAISKHLLKRRGLISSTHIRPPIDYFVDKETIKEVETIYDRLISLASTVNQKLAA